MMDLSTFTAPRQLFDDNNVVPLHSARTTTDDDDNNSGIQQQALQQQRNYDRRRNNPASDDEFHLTIPAFLTAHGRSLAQMDQAALAECLQPVLKSLRNLNAESLLALERVENGARLCDKINVRPIHDELVPRYDSFGGISCVRYVHITEVPEQYSIGIFVFPPFARIPLHDHPEMCVLSRLLYGDLQCLSLDLPGDDPNSDEGQDNNDSMMDDSHSAPQQHLFPEPSSQSRSNSPPRGNLYHRPHHPEFGHHEKPPAGFPPGSCRAYKNPIKHLHAPDVSLLFPYKGNLHEFFAGPNGAAVLDILLPPYDMEHDRDCTFYDIREDAVAAAAAAAQARVNPQQPAPMSIDHGGFLMGDGQLLGGQDGEAANRTPCWIVPTGQPHDFHCLSGQYHKLGANIISMQDTSR